MDKEYKAYLIRFTRSLRSQHWRVMLEDPHSGEILHFATENDMFRYLARHLRAPRVPQLSAPSESNE